MHPIVRTTASSVLFLCSAAFAQQASTKPFRFTVTKASQCTGDTLVIRVDGTIDSEFTEAADGSRHYGVQSRMTGSFSKRGSGKPIHFVGAESADFVDPIPEGEVTLFTHARVISEDGRELAVVGYDAETISFDAAGNITKVENAFDFTCD